MENCLGVYIITNTINNKVYIGQAKKVKNRMHWGHLRYLQRNKHYNKHLQYAWNKYTAIHGEECFKFEILEKCKKEILNDREVYWIACYKANNPKFGYNGNAGGNWPRDKKRILNSRRGKPTWIKGKHHTLESRILISINNGRCWLGKHLPKYMKNKISESMKGERNPMFGKKAVNYIPITQEMLDDYKNGITQKEFCVKYKVSGAIWCKVLKINNVIRTVIQITEGMKEDCRNGISGKDFCEKYKVGYFTWSKIRKSENIIIKTKPSNYIPVTDAMLEDYNNGIPEKEFYIKYKVSRAIWNKIRNGRKHIPPTITEEMIMDRNDGISGIEFCKKHNCTRALWQRVRGKVGKRSKVMITEGMLEDYKLGITRIEFCKKYKETRATWDKMRKGKY